MKLLDPRCIVVLLISGCLLATTGLVGSCAKEEKKEDGPAAKVEAPAGEPGVETPGVPEAKAILGTRVAGLLPADTMLLISRDDSDPTAIYAPWIPITSLGVLQNPATARVDLGAITPFLYAFRDRERILKIFEKLCGQRLNYSYIRVGGVTYDITDEILADIAAFCEYFDPVCIDEYDNLLSYNGIFVARTANVGVIPADLAIQYGVTGPSLRGAGLARDLRKDEPYSIYDRFEFDVPVGTGEMGTLGDCWDRYMVRIREMRESVRIIRQALDGIPADGPFCDKKAFRAVKPKPSEAYHKVEGARGEVAFYIVSDGKDKPYRCRARGASFNNISVLDTLTSRGDCMLADLVAIIGSLDIVLGEVDR